MSLIKDIYLIRNIGQQPLNVINYGGYWTWDPCEDKVHMQYIGLHTKLRKHRIIYKILQIIKYIP